MSGIHCENKFPFVRLIILIYNHYRNNDKIFSHDLAPITKLQSMIINSNISREINKKWQETTWKLHPQIWGEQNLHFNVYKYNLVKTGIA